MDTTNTTNTTNTFDINEYMDTQAQDWYEDLPDDDTLYTN